MKLITANLLNRFWKNGIKPIKTAIDNHVSAKASASVLGNVKLTDSAAVTDSTGLALPATEKNASVKGTLANQISVLNTDLEGKALKSHTHDDKYYTESEIDALLGQKQDKGTVFMQERTANNAYIPGNGNDVVLAEIDVQAGLYLFIGQLIVPIDSNTGSVSLAVTNGMSVSSSNAYTEHPFKSGTYVSANMSYVTNITQNNRYRLAARQTSGTDTSGGRYYFQVIRLSV